MKSLKESIFDSDLVSKDITFRNFWELVNIEFVYGNWDVDIILGLPNHKYENLEGIFNKKIVKKYKTTQKDSNEIYKITKDKNEILSSLLTIIYNTPLDKWKYKDDSIKWIATIRMEDYISHIIKPFIKTQINPIAYIENYNTDEIEVNIGDAIRFVFKEK